MAERDLVRGIGLRALTASVVNATVGAGIFVLPGVVGAQLGAAAPVAYIVCALTMGLIVASLSFVGSFGQLVLLSNVAVLLLYLLCSVSAFVLARRDVRPETGTAFTFPGQRVVPVLACLVVAWVLSNATLEELAVTALAAGGATVLYVLRWAQHRLP